jgi:ABC-type transporter Mla MlaB component
MAKAQKITLKAQPIKGKSKSEDEIALIIQGELTIDHAQKLKDFLLDKLEKYNHFALLVSEVENIDLGAVQIIQRFVWDVKELKKSIDLTIDLPQDFLHLLNKTGLNSFIEKQ